MAELIKYNLSGTPKKIQQNITADSPIICVYISKTKRRSNVIAEP